MKYSLWMGTPFITRVKIAQQFGIAKLRATHVSDNVVVDDGYNAKDIESAMNVEAMQAFLESKDTDVDTLFALVVERIENPVITVVSEPIVEVSPELAASNAKPEKIRIDENPSKAKVEKIMKAFPKKRKITK
jgi:hypothetical protein